MELILHIVDRVHHYDPPRPPTPSPTTNNNNDQCSDSCSDACSDLSFSLLFFDASLGVSFTAASTSSQDCTTYVFHTYLPPANGAYGFDLRLLHVGRDGVAEPSEEEMETLAYPANLGGQGWGSGPFSYNLRLEELFDLDPPLPHGKLYVVDHVDGPGWAPLDANHPECKGLSGFDEVDRAGWWLPPYDGERPIFHRLAAMYYTVRGCPVSHLPASHAASCLEREPLILVGESIGGHVARMLLQHSDPIDETMVRKSGGRGNESVIVDSTIGKFDHHLGILTPLDPVYAGTQHAQTHKQKMAWYECHGLKVLENEKIANLGAAATLVVVMGANDAMRETSEIWRNRWLALFDRLDDAGFAGTFVLVTTPVRRYKHFAHGDCSVRHGPSPEKPFESLCYNGDYVYSMRDEDERTVLGATLTTKSRPSRAGWREGTKPDYPFFYNTHPRISAFVELAEELVTSRFPADRRKLVDYFAFTASLDVDRGSRDGVHACQFTRSLWPSLLNAWHNIHCGPTTAAVDVLIHRICAP